MLNIDNFRHPVVFDSHNEFAKQNELPCRDDCHTFLLNSDNIIIAVGNPIINPKVKRLYKNIISGLPIDEFDEDTTDIKLCTKQSLSLGLMSISDTTFADIELCNNDSNPIHIENIVPSCGCITVKELPTSIAPNKTAKIKIAIFPTVNSSTSFDQSISVFYKGNEKPEIIKLYGFIDNQPIY